MSSHVLAERASFLRDAKKLLRTTGWDPRHEATDTNGNRVGAIWTAAAYSLVGAINHCSHGDAKSLAYLAIDLLGSKGITSPLPLNQWEQAEGRTHEQVERLIDAGLVVIEKNIALAEQAEQREREMRKLAEAKSLSLFE